jgi:hypothetical protein
MPKIDVLVARGDEEQIVAAGRPVHLIAFYERFGHDSPQNVPELAWLTHRALGVEEPLQEWVKTLDELTAAPIDVQKARARMHGEGEITTPEAIRRAAAELGISEEQLAAASAGLDPTTPTPVVGVLESARPSGDA